MLRPWKDIQYGAGFTLQIAMTIFFDNVEEVGEFVVPALLLTNFVMIPMVVRTRRTVRNCTRGVGDQLVI